MSLYAVVRDSFGWLPTPPAASGTEEGPSAVGAAVAAEGRTWGPWHAAALERMRGGGGARHSTGASGSAGAAAAGGGGAEPAGESEVVRASPPHLSLCALPSAEAGPCADQPCANPADGAVDGAADGGIACATNGASGDVGDAGNTGTGVAGGGAGGAGGAALAAVRVLEVPSLRAALLVGVEAVAGVREAGVRGWATRRGVGEAQLHEALRAHAEEDTGAVAGGAHAREVEGGGSEACDPDVASLRQLLAPSSAPMTVAAVGDAAGEAAGEGGVAGEGDAPLKAAVEGLHARFLLEAFLSAARREMTGLQSRFDEMASEMRACGVYLGAATQPKETKEQLKELGAIKDFVRELCR